MYFEVAAKVICVGLLMFQGGILDTYLVIEHGIYWCFWVIADVLVILVWVVSLYLAHRHFKRKRDQVDGRAPEDLPDELPFAFVAWIAYVLLLAPRLVLLFGKAARSLDENNIFGPNFLKTSAACTPLIFLLLVSGHHDAKPHSERRHYIDRLTGIVTLDLFDSMDLLEVAFEHESRRQFPEAIVQASLSFAIIMLLLPTFSLYELRAQKPGGRTSPLSFKLIYTASFVLLVNVPNLIIRSVIWHKYNADVSVLVMKNVMCIVIGMIDIFDYINNGLPQKCTGCSKYYHKVHITEHSINCIELDIAMEDVPVGGQIVQS